MAKELAKANEDNMSTYDEYISFKKAVLIAVFKLAYTQIFGIYSGFVYVHTGSLWAAIALHAQCNYFGFPSFQNLWNGDIRRTERIFIIVLYVVGILVVFRYFSWFTGPADGDQLPWWDHQTPAVNV